MSATPRNEYAALASNATAPQHGPRPLPLFLQMLWRETDSDPDLRQKAFEGLARYQAAPRKPRAETASTVAVQGNARLLRYNRDDGNGRTPVVFIPSLINPPFILDLNARQSLLRYLSQLGQDPYLVDWGAPDANDATLDLGDHVTQRLQPLLSALGRPAILVGYCLGGTLALAAAMQHTPRALATIASPWNFDGFSDDSRAQIRALWEQGKPMCTRLGYVPMEVLQSGFWALSPSTTIRKYADFAAMPENSVQAEAFVAMEDWANEGAPLTFAAGCELFETLYEGNATGSGAWTVGGSAVEPSTVSFPTLSISSTTDRIVPDAASLPAAEMWRLNMGHVGMIVGSRARNDLWEPLAAWLFKQGA